MSKVGGKAVKYIHMRGKGGEKEGEEEGERGEKGERERAREGERKRERERAKGRKESKTERKEKKTKKLTRRSASYTTTICMRMKSMFSRRMPKIKMVPEYVQL